MDDIMDVAVVGAGQAGLAVSYLLRRSGVQHVVLERGRIGESWRSQRWDSFYLNTLNWGNGLPGSEFHPGAADAFGSRDQLVSFFERYASSFDLPVRQHTAVTALERLSTGGYALHTEEETLRARAVVLATGGMSRPKVPSMARRLSSEIINLSAGTFRNAEALPNGAVVVVGSGQSGCQIAEELLAAGRRVYVCASRVGRVPRVYRGRDSMDWMRDMGFLEVRIEELKDPSMQYAAQPQVSGTNGGHTVSLQSLARDGATLLGRVLDVEGNILKLGSDLRECVVFADDKAKAFKADIDAFIDREGIQAKAPEPDPGEPALPDLKGSDRLETLDLRSTGVGSVIWCTGFDADWSWVKVDVFDERGRPRQRAGITESPGLYFVGLPWLAKRKSGILYGVSEDAVRIVEHIESHVLALNAG
ncbi:MAG: NAD(P)-binding domain-containing protein [Spirochaetaceae bacterium]|nr:MAG: NAD(P)-binding domain-containing protein [Spirochaetaceae bacterium]